MQSMAPSPKRVKREPGVDGGCGGAQLVAIKREEGEGGGAVGAPAIVSVDSGETERETHRRLKQREYEKNRSNKRRSRCACFCACKLYIKILFNAFTCSIGRMHAPYPT